MTTFQELFETDEPEDVLDALIYNGKIGGAELVAGPEVVAEGRWSLTKRIAFRHRSQFYRVDFDVPATEMQDIGPWDYTSATVVEVFPKEVTTTVYEPLIVRVGS